VVHGVGGDRCARRVERRATASTASAGIADPDTASAAASSTTATAAATTAASTTTAASSAAKLAAET
jgi:hypothetical protein